MSVILQVSDALLWFLFVGTMMPDCTSRWMLLSVLTKAWEDLASSPLISLGLSVLLE